MIKTEDFKCPPQERLWDKIEKNAVFNALKANKGNLVDAAITLGLSYGTVRRMAIKHGLWPWKG